MVFQSRKGSSKSKQIDSRAILTGKGGFDIDLTSTRCCLLMALTADFFFKFDPDFLDWQVEKEKKKRK